MRLFIILTVLTFLVGTGFWVSFDKGTFYSQTEVTNDVEKKVGEQNRSKDSQADLSLSKDNGVNLQTNQLDEWQTLQGQALQHAMDTFWVSCRADNNCLQLLAEYQTKLSMGDLRMLKYYPELSKKWQQVLGNLELNQESTLSERVEELKTQAGLVWGSDASRILKDEFALYDFTIESYALDSSSPDSYIDNFQNLIDRWEDEAQQLGIDNQSAIFEMGIDLIPDHFDTSDRKYISDRLANTYLSVLQMEDILLRQQQVTAQKQQVKDYNSQLSQFKNELSQQRASSASKMSDAEWQVHYETAIRQFRVDFFSQ